MAHPRDEPQGAMEVFLVTLEKAKLPVGIIGGVLGLVGGFYVGGIGGAIVGVPAGVVLAMLILHAIPLIVIGGGIILAIVLAVVVVVLLIWGLVALITSLWGVGRP